MALITYIHDLAEVIVPRDDAPDVKAKNGEPVDVPDDLAQALVDSGAWVAADSGSKKSKKDDAAPAVDAPADAAPAADAPAADAATDNTKGTN